MVFPSPTKILYVIPMPEKHRRLALELRHLRYFLAVAERGSVLAAAPGDARHHGQSRKITAINSLSASLSSVSGAGIIAYH